MPPELRDDGAARHLVAGLTLPDSPLPGTDGSIVSPARVTRKTVLYVYPFTGRPGVSDPPGWDDIPGAHGSTPQAEGFRDHYAAFQRLGVAVYGISGQSTAYQKEFSERVRLPFALLSDERFALQTALSLPVFQAGAENYLTRLTMIIEDGRIVRTLYPVPSPATHAADVLTLLGCDR
jgi:peroxiredoxin